MKEKKKIKGKPIKLPTDTATNTPSDKDIAKGEALIKQSKSKLLRDLYNADTLG